MKRAVETFAVDDVRAGKVSPRIVDKGDLFEDDDALTLLYPDFFEAVV